MTTLACRLDPRFTASDLDAPRPDGAPNYTVHVLTALREQHPRATLFKLVGLDTFLTLPHWHQSARVLTLARLDRRQPPRLHPRPLRLHRTNSRHAFHAIDSVHEDVSATTLRHRLQQGDPCLDLIPAPPSPPTSPSTVSIAIRPENFSDL